MVRFWHIHLAFLLTGCSAAETPAQTLTPEICPAIIIQEVSEAIQDQADSLAIELGISTEEAICRMVMMATSGDLNARLEQNEADTFAGLWLLHEPEFKVVVAFSRDGEEIIQPYVENSILAGSIEVREAEVTQAELYTLEMEANQLVERLGLSMIGFTLVNIQENQVEIHISNANLLEERLAANRLELPDQVKVVSSQKESGSNPPPSLTPVPGVHFPQLIAPPALVYAITTVGRLQSDSGCLRLTRTNAEPGPLLIWQPGHYLHSNQGVVEVLNQDGEVLAREGGLSCFSPAAGELAPDADWLLRSPLPKECAPPNFVVGAVQLAYQENQNSTWIDVELVDLENGSFYFIRTIADFDDWVEEPATISGKLVRQDDSRCVRFQRESQAGFQDDLVFWPPASAIHEESGTIEITSGQVEAVARLNEEVRLSGSLLKAGEQLRLHLNDELPCDCIGGDYWVVMEER